MRDTADTNVIERCFVKVRRHTWPMDYFVNVESVERIIYSIFQRFNPNRPAPSTYVHTPFDVPMLVFAVDFAG